MRRQFDTASRYTATFVDIKSKYLRDTLREVIGSVKGINLVTEKPALDPNMLFLYLEELRQLHDNMTATAKTLDNKKEKKAAKLKVEHLKVLLDYLDEDYEDTKKTLYPMLEAGIISYEYLWALFKPNTILYASTYGDESEPRALKAVSAREVHTLMSGKSYHIESRYLDYDGKDFGLASYQGQISQFSGSCKISSLSCYPIQFHKDPEKAKEELIERGKQFVALQGMNYKTYSGMAFVKKEDKILKVDVNGRAMIDPAIFRKVNPNYPLSTIRSPHTSIEVPPPVQTFDDFAKHRSFKVVKDKDGNYSLVETGTDAAANFTDDAAKKDIFTEEQLLIASPLVVGFSFTEKMWLEFAVSKIGEIRWNTDAFDSLILPNNQKGIVKAMVSSHAFHPSRSIDDIIAGKGKGLVAVLHGGPGLGKTLTVESIADLLKRPLYMVSAGDLGTNSSTLERELQSILDIAHAWGAVLLLDEADVFLEKRSTHDIHRNALVSIFLRLLEYFQGILFLTTNRVEVFDDAFVSRIHLSLRYSELSTKAKKAVWNTFINMVREAEGMEVEDIEERDLDDLSRRALNGRQIKNIVRAAQALAIHEDVALGMVHIRTVLDVAQTFERDLKGGTGYEDAMRSYH